MHSFIHPFIHSFIDSFIYNDIDTAKSITAQTNIHKSNKTQKMYYKPIGHGNQVWECGCISEA